MNGLSFRVSDVLIIADAGRLKPGIGGILVLLFILLLITQSGFANEASEFAQIAARADEISSAPCFVSYSSSRFSYSDYFSDLYQNSPQQSDSVGGLHFPAAPEKLIFAYRRLTSHVNYKLDPILDIDYWERFKEGQCRDPLCAAKVIFGRKRGELFLAIQSLTGVNLSHLGYSRLEPPVFEGESTASPQTIKQFDAMYSPSPWELPELEIYLNGLLNLPASVFPLPPNTRLLKNDKSHWRGAHVHANAAITLYPEITHKDPLYKIYTLVHEVGHIVGAAKGVNQDRRWVELSWDIQRDRVVQKPGVEFISAYAGQDYFEDFAESFAAYRFVPDKLRELAPKKYEYLKRHIFAGQEYQKGQACPQPIGAALLPLAE